MLPRLYVIVIPLLLQACTNMVEAPAQGEWADQVGHQTVHTVVKGDTLFSIAMRYDLDYKKLAASNGIYAPYIIRPGDRIVISESAASKVVSVPENVAVAKTYPVTNSVTVKENEKNTGNKSNNALKQSNTLTNVNESKSITKPVATVSPKVMKVGGERWIWPANGNVIRQFSPQDALSKGIDIGGVMGAPVLAARSGEVVYAGNGLKGYGNLIIVRHDDTFISAYAHNRLMLVKEGQQVKQGDRIAELGMSGTEAPKLHFEIRELGKPIDPLKYLPDK